MDGRAGSDDRKTVVVLDDDWLVARAQSVVIFDLGFHTITGRSLEDVRDTVELERNHIKCIVADFNLGGPMTGFDVAISLREIIGRDVPIIIVSGSAGDRARLTALRNGFPFLMKPVDAGRFEAVLLRVIED